MNTKGRLPDGKSNFDSKRELNWFEYFFGVTPTFLRSSSCIYSITKEYLYKDITCYRRKENDGN